MTLETALQIAYAVTLLAFGLRDWQMRRRVRTLSRRVRALLDLSRDRVVDKIREEAPGYEPGRPIGRHGSTFWSREEDVLDALPDPGLARRFP